MLSKNPYNPMSYNMYTSLHGYQPDNSQLPQSLDQHQQQYYQQQPQPHQQQPQQQQPQQQSQQSQQLQYQLPLQRHHQLPPAYMSQQTHNHLQQYQTVPNSNTYNHSAPSEKIQSQSSQYQTVTRSETPNSIHSNDYTVSQTVPLIYSPQSTISLENSALSSADSSITQNLDHSDSIIAQKCQQNLSYDESSLLNSSLKVNTRPLKSRSSESFSKISKQHSQAQLALSRQKIVKNIDIKNSSKNDDSKPLSDTYIPSDPTLDLSFFTEEDTIILKNMLPAAEIQKWKYASQRLSKIRSKKLNAEFCISKFHAMFGLPFNPKKSLLQSIYSMKADSKDTSNSMEENFEGILGSSIPYVVARDGWNSIDP